MLPPHDVVIIDEAHDLVDRVRTSATTGELSGPAVDAAARRSARLTESPQEGSPAVAEGLRHAAAALSVDLADAPAGRMDELSDALAATLRSVHEAADACAKAVRANAEALEEDPQRMGTLRMTLASLDELHSVSGRILGAFGADVAGRDQVVWLDRPFSDDSRRPPTLRVAPLEVGPVLRERLFRQHTVALTSATLALGGSFDPLAIQWGLGVPARGRPPGTRATRGDDPPEPVLARGDDPPESPDLGRTARPPRPPRPPRGGPGSTSGRRSTIRVAASCTWPGTSRRRAGTSSPRVT